MSSSSKKQAYTPSLRTAAVVDLTFCTHKTFFYLIPPAQALTIENLRTRFVMQFDAAIAAGDRIIESIGVANEIPTDKYSEPDRYKAIELNQAADGSRMVDIDVDLTALLKKDNVAFRSYYGTYETTDFTYIMVKVQDALSEISNVGTIKLWKTDGLFYTARIR